MKKKKICCITTIASTLEVFVVDAMQRFVDDEYEVTLISSMPQAFINKYSDRFKCVNIKMHRGISILDLFRN